MGFTLVFTLLIASAAFLYLLKRKNAYGNIPLAKGSTWMGVGKDFALNPVGFLVEQRRKLGDVFVMDLFILKFVVLLGAKNSSKVLKASDNEFHFLEGIIKTQPQLKSMAFYVSPEGNPWYEVSFKFLRSFMDNTRLDNYQKEWIKIAKKHFNEWEKQESINWFISISNLLLEASFTSSIGQDFYLKVASEEGRNLPDEYRRYESLIVNPLNFALPKWMTPQGREFVRIENRLLLDIHEECVRRLKDPEAHKDRTDYLQYLLNQAGGEFLACYPMHLLSVSLAAHTNTVGTFAWTALQSLNAGKMDRIRKEIDENEEKAVGGIYPLTGTPFLEACMRETGRLYTNLLMMRKVKEDSTVFVGDSEIPVSKGSLIALSPITNQQDPNIFEEPSKWIPERFLDEDKYKNWFRNQEFVQFGWGRHACLGERFTHRLLRGIMWTNLLRNYEIELVDGKREGVGINGVGFEPDWGNNVGTPFAKGRVGVKVSKRRL
eukprot:TRINITY_DN1315_c0_g1_i1.p1 TRINITY_DN1315_c0_g1~~TRINITY_DN1315_c0_g1_i1.p1  ORF type:complete len:490 (-),score=164.44 TRINITY_DN1315_c0_g1_i1:82-1551(-)